MNNGHASEPFFLERGVRQGCPLSGILFIIAIELLAQQIRRSEMIKGIEIANKGSQEVKLSQYADDTTVLLRDSESVVHLFELLSLFERCSGLKINESKSELLWLGSWRHRKDKFLDLQLSDVPVYALGVHFSYDHDAVLRKNFWDKLTSLKKLFNIWSQRDISVYGKINLVKSLALSKLVFICSVMETPKHFVNEVNKIVLDFIWNHKPPKIKFSTLIKPKKEGGLEMKDFSLFNKALKLNWVKRLCSNSNAPWKYIPKSLLANVGGLELFNCNYDISLLNLNKHLPVFYGEIITFWQDLIASNPKSKNDVLEQICWNNKFITSDRKSIYYPLWRLAGICKIKDLVDTQQKCFLSFDSFCNKFNVRCNFLQYFGLVNAIPQSWKKLLDSAGEQGSTSQIIIDEITCKEIYTMLLSLQPTPPPTCEKRLLNRGYLNEDMSKVYLLPFEATREVKLSMFQYKIIHNILCTKSLLFKMKKEDSPCCPFCPMDHTIAHLFTECTQAISFWKEFLDWASRVVNSRISLSKNEIMFGIINQDSTFCLALNHLVIIGKYFLYVNTFNNKAYIFNEFVSLVRDKIKVEKYILCTSGRGKEFKTKWSTFHSVFNTL